MKNAPAFQLYAADFYMDTAAWSATEVGAYFRLLLHEWTSGPLPNDMMALSRIAGVDHKTMGKFWSMNVGKKFTQNDKGEWENYRLEQTRKEQQEHREKQVVSGKCGANKRWGKEEKMNGDPNGDPNGENIALHSSSSISGINTTRVSKDTLVCPHQEIISLYHKILPELAEIKKWTNTRKKHLQVCWSDSTRQNIDWWKEYFQEVRGSPFLMGKIKEFRADLEWLTNETNLVKVLEGKYKNGNGNGSGTYGGTGKTTQKTGGARSDDQPYPVDAEY